MFIELFYLVKDAVLGILHLLLTHIILTVKRVLLYPHFVDNKIEHREFKLVEWNYSANKWQIQGLNKRGHAPEPVFLTTDCSSPTADMDEKIGQEPLT